MRLIRWLFSPVFEAFEIDKLVTDCNGLDITCGCLDSYETEGEL
jgi:hypothetical protein